MSGILYYIILGTVIPDDLYVFCTCTEPNDLLFDEDLSVWHGLFSCIDTQYDRSLDSVQNK